MTATSRAALPADIVHPVAHPGDQRDDGFAAVRAALRVGQPDRELIGLHRGQLVSAPSPAVEVGQPRLDSGLQAEQLRGLPGPPFGRTHRKLGIALIGGVDLALPHGVQRLVSGESSGCHRVGHGVRDQGQPDDLTHAGMLDRSREPSNRCIRAAKTSPMVAHITTWVPSENSRNS